MAIDLQKWVIDWTARNKLAHEEGLRINFRKLTQEQISRLADALILTPPHEKNESYKNTEAENYKKAEKLIKLLKECEKLHEEFFSVDHKFMEIKIDDEVYTQEVNLYEFLIDEVKKIATKNQGGMLMNSKKILPTYKVRQIRNSKSLWDICQEFGFSKTYSYEIIKFMTGIASDSFLDKALSDENKHLHPLQVKFGKAT